MGRGTLTLADHPPHPSRSPASFLLRQSSSSLSTGMDVVLISTGRDVFPSPLPTTTASATSSASNDPWTSIGKGVIPAIDDDLVSLLPEGGPGMMVARSTPNRQPKVRPCLLQRILSSHSSNTAAKPCRGDHNWGQLPKLDWLPTHKLLNPRYKEKKKKERQEGKATNEDTKLKKKNQTRGRQGNDRPTNLWTGGEEGLGGRAPLVTPFSESRTSWRRKRKGSLCPRPSCSRRSSYGDPSAVPPLGWPEELNPQPKWSRGSMASPFPVGCRGIEEGGGRGGRAGYSSGGGRRWMRGGDGRCAEGRLGKTRRSSGSK